MPGGGDLRVDLPADHADHQQLHVQERRDVHREIRPLDRIQLPQRPSAGLGVPEAAMKTSMRASDSTSEATMKAKVIRRGGNATRQRGQILVVAVIAMVVMIG